MGTTFQNMAQTSNSLLSPLSQWLLGATNGNQGQIVIHYQISKIITHL